MLTDPAVQLVRVLDEKHLRLSAAVGIAEDGLNVAQGKGFDVAPPRYELEIVGCTAARTDSGTYGCRR